MDKLGFYEFFCGGGMARRANHSTRASVQLEWNIGEDDCLSNLPPVKNEE
ncbi:hypothetical protein [Methylocapsa sp. S129]|nr:hypothetical protein [Methylocapsa sp. S129]